jgi:sugar lactone lactonase YvrE
MKFVIHIAVAGSLFMGLSACVPDTRADSEVVTDIQNEATAQTLHAPQLEKLWLLEGFDAPEGVAAASDGNLFISNVTGEGTDRDGTGFVSIITRAGEMVEARWAEGLNGPKGMAVKDGVLYVSDIDRVARFNIETRQRLNDIPIEGAVFLNDASVWQGNVYVADSGTGTIHRIVGDDAEILMSSEELDGVNGLLGNGDYMLVSTMSAGELHAYSQDGKLDRLCTGMTNADGIGVVPGGFLVSSWPGQIWFCDATSGETTELLNTVATEIYQNDLTVFGDLVIVPNWQPGTVTAYRVINAQALD